MSFHLANAKQNALDAAERERYATTAGVRRKEVQKIFRAWKKEENSSQDVMFSVPYGSAVVYVLADGSILSKKSLEQRLKEKAAENKAKQGEGQEDPTHEDDAPPPSNWDEAAAARFYINPRLEDSIVAGASPLNKMIGKKPVACGAEVLVGPSGVGKTPVAHYCALYGVESYGVVRIGEPFSGYTTNHHVAAESIARAIVYSQDIVIDSIKDLLAQAGNAMKGGIARNALLDLSAWSILGATLGVTFYVPLNPSSGDEATLKMMGEIARSNTVSTMEHDSESKWTYSVRTGEGMPRVKGSITITGKPQIDTAVETTIGSGVAKHTARDLSNILSGVTARANLFNV